MAPQAKAELERALDSDEFVAYFQPILDMKTGRVSSFEALARWHHPAKGTICPDKFIPLAESSRLINRLTDSILQQVFRTARTVPDSIRFNVNVSPVQLRDELLPQRLQTAAEEAGFPLHRLTIEITETAVLGNLDRAVSIAHRLKALGMHLAIDDFGTGYSSLSHLQALPLDSIKVDQTFVRAMVTRRQSRDIVSAVLGLGGSLGLQTVAEGVTTTEQEHMLQWLGCDYGQGWLYGHPLPAQDLAHFLSQHAAMLSASPYRCDARQPVSFQLDRSTSRRMAHLQSLYDGAPVGLCFLDRSMRYTSVNRHLAAMTGVPVEDHIGRTVSEATPFIAGDICAPIEQALRGESVTGIELPFPSVDPDAPSRFALMSFQPAWDEAGEVIGVSISVIDITEQKNAEFALGQSERHYLQFGKSKPRALRSSNAAERRRNEQLLHQSQPAMSALMNLSPVGLLLAAAPDGHVLQANAEAERLLGRSFLSPDGNLNGWLAWASGGAPVHWTNLPMMRSIRHGHAVPAEEFLYQRGDGSFTRLTLSSQPIVSEDGSILGSVMTVAPAGGEWSMSLPPVEEAAV